MREAAKRLRNGGRIISFSSRLYQPTYGIHAATKAGVEAMTCSPMRCEDAASPSTLLRPVHGDRAVLEGQAPGGGRPSG